MAVPWSSPAGSRCGRCPLSRRTQLSIGAQRPGPVEAHLYRPCRRVPFNIGKLVVVSPLVCLILIYTGIPAAGMLGYLIGSLVHVLRRRTRRPVAAARPTADAVLTRGSLAAQAARCSMPLLLREINDFLASRAAAAVVAEEDDDEGARWTR